MTSTTAPQETTVGEWTWTTNRPEKEPALCLPHGFEIREGVDAACLRKLALDLMKLANAVAKLP